MSQMPAFDRGLLGGCCCWYHPAQARTRLCRVSMNTFRVARKHGSQPSQLVVIKSERTCPVDHVTCSELKAGNHQS
eukprot:85014-Amphidinium_carterae.2